MEPRSIERGKRTERTVERHFVLASMEPRSIERGKRWSRRLRCSWDRGFNGAAIN